MPLAGSISVHKINLQVAKLALFSLNVEYLIFIFMWTLLRCYRCHNVDSVCTLKLDSYGFAFVSGAHGGYVSWPNACQRHDISVDLYAVMFTTSSPHAYAKYPIHEHLEPRVSKRTC